MLGKRSSWFDRWPERRVLDPCGFRAHLFNQGTFCMSNIGIVSETKKMRGNEWAFIL